MRVLRIFHSAVVDSWRERERALQRLGISVELLSARVWNEGGTDISLVPREGEPVVGMRTFGKHPALFVYDPRPLWRALGRTWDIIDIHEEPFSLATAEILLIRRLRRQPAPYVLYSAQNLDKRYPVPFRWLERWSLSRASGISVCNIEAGQIVQRKGLPGVPSVIPLGIDATRFRPANDPRDDAPLDPIQVGYVGRLAKHKGVNVLLKAIARDCRLHLRVAGAGSLDDTLRQQVRFLGIAERVDFVGAITHEGLPQFYAGLDVLAIPSLSTPSWTEQFGRVAVEAMACGVPVVASDSGALADVVSGGGLLIPPGDPDALATALVHLGTSPETRSRLRQGALARARECTWDRVAERYLDMYRRAAHESTPSMLDREVEIVVIAYGASELLEKALTPIQQLPVTVVDNSSSDDVRRVCSAMGVQYIDPAFNGGFATGVNTALRHRLIAGADVLLLNPDAVISPAGIRELQHALLGDPHIASAGPHQVDEHGAASRVTWPFPSPLRTWLQAVGLDRLHPRSQFVIGSVLLLRAEALEQVGCFDQSFFMYGEETDWAYRATRLGWRHVVVPTATAIHVGAATSSDPSRREVHFHASQERYMRKHWTMWGWQMARAGQLVGAATRTLALGGGRGQAARRRFMLYLRGPVKVETTHWPRETEGSAGAA